MAHIELTFITIFFFFFFSPTLSTNTTCPVLCGGLDIRFPFTINEDDHCGFPNFLLACSNNQSNTVVLSLPYQSGNSDFIVQAIDYKVQAIWINDRDYCLPKRFLEGFNSVAGSPFDSTYSRIFTFLNCSFNNNTIPSVVGLRHVPCLSASNFSVFALPTSDYIGSTEIQLSKSCVEISNVSVPVQWPPWDDDLRGGARLTWRNPDCRSCENHGGICLLKDYSSLSYACFDLPKKSNGLSKGAKYGMIIGIIIPSLICLTAITCYYASKFRAHYGGQVPNPTAIDLTITAGPSQAVLMNGLDRATIESYPKILIGDGGLLPRSGDNVCPICLSEYETNDTLRSIPECNHYFHSDCVDEWLKINATCPLCRKLPEDAS
ncbi:hypothetical protein ACFE04_007256 [Oxalis oulophora]